MVKRAHIRILLLVLFSLGTAAGLALLLYSVINSGYHYTLDNDELSQAHVVYLMSQGKEPFKDFFSIYSPLFQWLISPIFSLRGFSLSTLSVVRMFMIGLFLIRLGAGAFLIKRLLSDVGVVLFLALILLDPFTTFAGMQIRPDNLMLTLFLLGMTSLTEGNIRKKRILLVISGALLGLALIASLKILLPLMLILGGVIVWNGKKHFHQSMPVLFGMILTLSVYLTYFVYKGTAVPMLQQTVVDAITTNNALLYPVPFGTHHRPDNIYIYGVMGRPLTWVYAWILPLFGFFGIGYIAAMVTKKPQLHFRDVAMMSLALSAAVSWGTLFFINSVFIQYYLPSSFFFALAGAIGTAMLYNDLKSVPLMRVMLIIGIAGVVLVIGKQAYNNNMSRAGIVGMDDQRYYTERWAKIPADKAVFPSFLFRPSSHPIIFGYFIGDIPQDVLSRYPSVATILEQQKTPYARFSGWELSHFDLATQEYLKTHYRPSDIPDLYVRANNKPPVVQ